MERAVEGSVTELLIRWKEGDRDCVDLLFPLVQAELRMIAARHMRREHPNHVLQPTALVNEAYLRLVDQQCASLKDRSHFFALAANLMRHILVDQARKDKTRKRGGGCAHVGIEENFAQQPAVNIDLLALDEALSILAKRSERMVKVVELRYFAGLDIQQTAEALHVSPETVMRDWRLAKAWLLRELKPREVTA